MADTRRGKPLRGRADAMAQRWSRRRQGADSLPVRLEGRRIYILPTRTGLASAVLVLAILAAGLNYGNGLVMLLGFLFAGFGLVNLHQCHRRLLGLVVQDLRLEPGFAGDRLSLWLRLGQAPDQTAADYRLSLRSSGGTVLRAGGIRAQEVTCFALHPEAAQRGRWPLPPLKLDCEAPAGLFRSWTWLHVDAGTLVYPRPGGRLPLPGAPAERGQASTAAAGQDEWTGLRPFREGDSPRQAAWKAYARGAPLLSREWQGLAGRSHAFDYSRLAGLDTESRLSQLAAWILEAERRQEAWSLSLPGLHLPPGQGTAQAHQALAALALHALPESAP